jgi:hypothetical protein
VFCARRRYDAFFTQPGPLAATPTDDSRGSFWRQNGRSVIERDVA